MRPRVRMSEAEGAGALTRYFARWNGDRVIGICRLAVDDEKRSLREELWNGTAWEPTEIVMRSLTAGDTDLDEITEDQAWQIAPAAFE